MFPIESLGHLNRDSSGSLLASHSYHYIYPRISGTRKVQYSAIPTSFGPIAAIVIYEHPRFLYAWLAFSSPDAKGNRVCCYREPT